MNAIIVKIGGSILEPPQSYYTVAEKIKNILREKKSKLIVVVSAMKGVTDDLLQAYINKTLPSRTFKIYQETARYIGDSKLENSIEKILEIVKNYLLYTKRTPWLKPRILSYGEIISKILLTEALKSLDLKVSAIDAVNVILTENKPDNARILYDRTLENLYKTVPRAFKNSDIIIVEGYIGSTINGQVATLGRGGSDYTATTLAALLRSREVYLYTDVPGILSGDPKYIPNPRRVPHLNYIEAYEASLHGAKKLHPRTFEPLIKIHNVKVKIGSLNDEFTVIDGKTEDNSCLFKIITALWNYKYASVTLIGDCPYKSRVIKKLAEHMRKHRLVYLGIHSPTEKPVVKFYVEHNYALPTMRVLHDIAIIGENI